MYRYLINCQYNIVMFYNMLLAKVIFGRLKMRIIIRYIRFYVENMFYNIFSVSDTLFIL